MSKRLLISDANILIDMESGGLLRQMFLFDARFAVPDLLFEEELRASHPSLLKLGLERIELSEDTVRYAEQLIARCQGSGASTNDLLALALAHQEACALLTGDKRLRQVGKAEGVEVHGPLWRVSQLITSRTIDYRQAEAGYANMRKANRRLPWDEVEGQLRGFKQSRGAPP